MSNQNYSFHLYLIDEGYEKMSDDSCVRLSKHKAQKGKLSKEITLKIRVYVVNEIITVESEKKIFHSGSSVSDKIDSLEQT